MEPVFGSSVFIVHDGAVLLGFHRKEQKWLPVGGKRQGQETPAETARREALEETGAAVRFLPCPTGVIGAPDGFFGYEEHETASGRRHMCFAFVGTVAAREDVALCPREFERESWFDRSALLHLETPLASRHVPQLALLALALVKETRYGRTPVLEARTPSPST